MEKIPCIKINKELWDYITPKLEEFGYKASSFECGEDIEYNDILVICDYDYYGDFVLGIYNNYNVEVIYPNKFELVFDVEEFLERAAKLKNKTYKRKDIMKINGIEIKPGMGIYINEIDSNNFYVVFPIKNELAVISYGRALTWDLLNSFINNNRENIVAIGDLGNKANLNGRILWKKSEKVIITKQQIADKFGYDVNQIEIK